MRIYNLSRVVAFPFVVALAIMLYLEFVLYYELGWWLLVPLLPIVCLIILHGDIDYWWLKKHPIPLDLQEKNLIEKFVPFYSKLDKLGKQKFEDRVSLYMGAREWKNVGTSELKDIPDDVKAIFASQVVQLTYNDDDFLLGDFDRVYTYKHPFPSPQFQYLHTVESNLEDGMLIFSMEHALPGISDPGRFYNIVMHGYAEAYVKQHPKKNYPDVSNFNWSHISQITSFSKDQILSVLGHKDIDFLTVAIMCFFTYPEKTKEINYTVYTGIEKVLV